MIIQSVHVKNFRSVLDETLPCDSLTALVGRNGSGKSSFLGAIALFYNASAKVTLEDFYAEDVSQDIEIEITFTNLSKEAKARFAPYVTNNSLAVVRVFSDPQSSKSGTYHGMRLQNPDFDAVRDAGGSMDIRRAYAELQKQGNYSALPSAGSADAVRKALVDWEDQNPSHCSLQRDDGQFFGFAGVAQGYLGQHTRFISVPAVRDAQEEATEKRGALVTEMMDLVVRNALANRSDVTDFRKRTQEEYKEIMDPERFKDLRGLSNDLSKRLQSYVPDSKVLLEWSQLTEIPIPMPQAQVKLMEDGYESRVELTGHGLQRAFIITMLQHLDAVRRMEPGPGTEPLTEAQEDTKKEDSQLPDLVLAIEEPELYQHPNRQRHLASVLLNLAEGAIPGVAENTQIIYTTHSPLFVGLDRFDRIRALRKVPQAGGMPRATVLREASMNAVANELWDASRRQGEKFTAQTLRPRLQAIMTPWMNEGFFADLIVLVEGEEDRAAILGVAKAQDIDLESMGVSVIPCSGKRNLDRPLVIFRQLGIPIYVMWDGDHGVRDSRPEDNRYLLRLLNEREEDWPGFVRGSSACFKVKLGRTIAEELGESTFNKLLLESRQDFGIKKKDQAVKNSTVIQQIIRGASSSGKRCTSLEEVLENIVTMRKQDNACP